VPVRGRCSKFRQEQQSCNAYFAALVPGKQVAGAAAAADEASEPGTTYESSAGITEHLPPTDTPDQQQQQQHGKKHHQHDSWPDHLLASAHRRNLLTHTHPAAAAAAAGKGSGAGVFSGSTPSRRHSQQQQQGLEDGFLTQAGSWLSHSLHGLTPQYVVSERDGRPPARPLLCGPGLVCTGDVEPMPNTCVKVCVEHSVAACLYCCCGTLTPTITHTQTCPAEQGVQCPHTSQSVSKVYLGCVCAVVALLAAFKTAACSRGC